MKTHGRHSPRFAADPEAEFADYLPAVPEPRHRKPERETVLRKLLVRLRAGAWKS